MFCRIMKSAHLRRMMSVAYTRNSRGDRNPNHEGFKRTEIKQAITLLWISVLYIACQSPKVIPDFYEAINCDYTKVFKHIIQLWYVYDQFIASILFVEELNFLSFIVLLGGSMSIAIRYQDYYSRFKSLGSGKFYLQFLHLHLERRTV